MPHITNSELPPSGSSSPSRKKKKRNPRLEIRWKQWQPSAEASKRSLGPGTAAPPLKASSQAVVTVHREKVSTTRRNVPKAVCQDGSTAVLIRQPGKGYRLDPFISLPIDSTPSVVSGLDYMIQMWSPGTTLKTSFAMRKTVNPHLSLLLPFAYQHAMVFEALIAVARAGIVLSQNSSTDTDTSLSRHRGQALIMLREELKTTQDADDVALVTVSTLLLLELLLGNTAAVNLHIEGLRQLLRLTKKREPVTPWDHFVILGVQTYEALGSFFVGKNAFSADGASEIDYLLPPGQPLQYPKSIFTPEIASLIEKLPIGFQDLLRCSKISVQMLRILNFIAEMPPLRLTQTDKSNSPSPQEEAETKRLNRDREYKMTTAMSALSRFGLLLSATMTPDRVMRFLEGESRSSSLSPALGSSTGQPSVAPVEFHLLRALQTYLAQTRPPPFTLTSLNLFHDSILNAAMLTNNKLQDVLLQPQLKYSPIRNFMIWVRVCTAGAMALRSIPMLVSDTTADMAVLDDLILTGPKSSTHSTPVNTPEANTSSPAIPTWPIVRQACSGFFCGDEMQSQVLDGHWKRIFEKWQRHRNEKDVSTLITEKNEQGLDGSGSIRRQPDRRSATATLTKPDPAQMCMHGRNGPIEATRIMKLRAEGPQRVEERSDDFRTMIRNDSSAPSPIPLFLEDLDLQPVSMPNDLTRTTAFDQQHMPSQDFYCQPDLDYSPTPEMGGFSEAVGSGYASSLLRGSDITKNTSSFSASNLSTTYTSSNFNSNLTTNTPERSTTSTNANDNNTSKNKNNISISFQPTFDISLDSATQQATFIPQESQSMFQSRFPELGVSITMNSNPNSHSHHSFSDFQGGPQLPAMMPEDHPFLPTGDGWAQFDGMIDDGGGDVAGCPFLQRIRK